MAEHRTIRATDAAHRPHGRKHRVGDVFLDLDTTRNGLPFLLRREREIYLAGRQNLIEAMKRAVRTPPKGDIEPAYFSTSTPWNVGKPKRARNVVAEGNSEVAARLLKRLEANIMRCNEKAIGRAMKEILQKNVCAPEQVADACNRAMARLRESGKRKEAFLMGAAVRRLAVAGLLENGEYRAPGCS